MTPPSAPALELPLASPPAAPPTTCTRCRTVVVADDELFCPACREPLATSLFAVDAGASAAPPAAPPAAAVVDRRAAAADFAPPLSSGLELALPTRCRVCGGALADDAAQRRGTCVLHAHLTGADARPTATLAVGTTTEREDARRPPGTGVLGSLAGFGVVICLGVAASRFLGAEPAPAPPATATAEHGGDAAGMATGVAGGGGLTPAEATARVDELLGGGAARKLGAASARPPTTPQGLAERTSDDEVAAEVEQLIAQSGHPTAPDLGAYEAILDGTDDGAPAATARGWAAVGQLDDDRARDVAEQKLDALVKAHPGDAAVALARAEVHVDDYPDAALAAAAAAAAVGGPGGAPDAARLRGVALAHKGEIEGAVAALTDAASDDPRAARTLLVLQSARGRCADVEAASAKLAADRGGQALVDHARLLASCRAGLDDARALVEAAAALPATTAAERAALQAVLAEAALARGDADLAAHACAALGDDGASPDLARARARCALAVGAAPPPAAAAAKGATTTMTLLTTYGVRDGKTAPWGRTGAQLRLVGALHDARPAGDALADVVEALWSPLTATGRVPPLGARELDALVDRFVPAARRTWARAIGRGLGGDVDEGLRMLGDGDAPDAALLRAMLLVAAGRLDDAKAALPTGPLAAGVVGRAVTALSPSSSPTTLRALAADPRVGPRVYRALVERKAATAADEVVARRFALHPDVIAARGAR